MVDAEQQHIHKVSDYFNPGAEASGRWTFLRFSFFQLVGFHKRLMRRRSSQDAVEQHILASAAAAAAAAAAPVFGVPTKNFGHLKKLR